MYMIWPQVSFLDLIFILLGQPTEYLPPIPPQFLVQSLPPTIRNENYMVFALPPSRGLGFLIRQS
jgi:hypothetical protein